MRNNYYLMAGIGYLFSAALHLIGGQLALVNPLIDSELDLQVRTEWLGAWHTITVMLFYFGIVLLKNGIRYQIKSENLIKAIGLLSVLFSYPSSERDCGFNVTLRNIFYSRLWLLSSILEIKINKHLHHESTYY